MSTDPAVEELHHRGHTLAVTTETIGDAGLRHRVVRSGGVCADTPLGHLTVRGDGTLVPDFAPDLVDRLGLDVTALGHQIAALTPAAAAESLQ